MNTTTALNLKEVHSVAIDAQRAIEVHEDQWGEYWVGMTRIRNERDWEFSPREQYGTGETGRSLAIARAESWAREIAVDARWTR